MKFKWVNMMFEMMSKCGRNKAQMGQNESFLENTCVRQVVLDKWFPRNLGEPSLWRQMKTYTMCNHVITYIHILSLSLSLSIYIFINHVYYVYYVYMHTYIERFNSPSEPWRRCSRGTARSKNEPWSSKKSKVEPTTSHRSSRKSNLGDDVVEGRLDYI